MKSSWGKIDAPIVSTMNFAEIMDEAYAQRVHQREVQRFNEQQEGQQKNESATGQDVSEKIANDTTAESKVEAEFLEVDADENKSDEVLARLLQCQYDLEYNEELSRIERHNNKQSKITISLDKFRRYGEEDYFTNAAENHVDDDDERREKRDWDRFETNEKLFETIPKCGFKIDKEGEMISKHDTRLCGVRNACRVMSFPPELATGDAAGFDMKLSNKVYNQLKTYSHRLSHVNFANKKNKQQDRKDFGLTTEMSLDSNTYLILFKMVNNTVLECVNGTISIGKEALILHAVANTSFQGVDGNGHVLGGFLITPDLMPKECAIKVFKTTLNDFKQRDRYIKNDYRFKDRFSKQNTIEIINMWAEKEMFNLKRMRQVGINCPLPVMLRKHVLTMSFIGDNGNAAPKLKNAILNKIQLMEAYKQIIDTMYKLYNSAKLVHADLSEYNILWHENKCWFIDVAQSVEPSHPSSLEFLMRDCDNIITFFRRRGLTDIFTKEQLFAHITSLEADNCSTAMLECIHTRGANVYEATAPNQDDCPIELQPLSFPFDLAWDMSVAAREANREYEREQERKDKNDRANIQIDFAAKAFDVLSFVSDNQSNSESVANVSNDVDANSHGNEKIDATDDKTKP